MNIKLNQKIIKERCGTVSFKRGDAFYRGNKVTWKQYSSDVCEATVTGKEDFYVVIERDANGGFRSTCSCPTLAGFRKDCQHIAAVLLTLNENQRDGVLPNLNGNSSAAAADQELTEGLLTLFQEPSIRTSGHQLHFENRQVLDVVFTCQPVDVSDGTMFGIKIAIGLAKVKNIRKFLEQVKERIPSIVSTMFTVDWNVHCFPNETDVVIQQLIQIMQDEKGLPEGVSHTVENDLLLLPPSYWEKLLPLLRSAPHVNMKDGARSYQGLHLSEEILPLQFDLLETERKGCQLKVTGLNRITVLHAYRAVLYDGKLTQLDDHDCKRLGELKRMLDATGTTNIPIPQEQLDFFLEKVVTGLKNLGEVTISKGLHRPFSKTPLVAKLYLDRVKNRLLAGIEFHYENSVINPLENHTPGLHAMLVRDTDKEEEILRLIEDSLFTKTESGYFLHNEELEYDFLYYVVPKLQKLAQVYTTTAVRMRVVKENTFPKIRVKVKKERTNWLEFKFEMDGLPEDQIRELLEALEEKKKYYRLRNGSLLSLETKEFQEVNHFLNGLPVKGENLESGLRLPVEQSLQLLDSVDTSNLFLAEESFRQFLGDIRQPGRMSYQVPDEVAPLLRDYQVQGFQWLKTLASYRFGGILADDMGLGKTVQSIAYILSELPLIREKQQPVLIICPSSVTYNWLSELLKFAPDIEALVIDGKKTERIEQQKKLSEVDVVITSYPILRRDIPLFEKHVFHTVFFDEAQAFKNPVTQTARAVKRIQANHRFALTGTPVENSIEELWSIFHVVFPELFLGLQQYSSLSRETIARRARPFLLRRLKEDVLLELPGKKESLQSMELLPEQKKLYAAYLAKLKHDTLKHLDRDTFRKNKIRILAGLTRLRQICCHPGLFVDNYQESSAKFEQLLQLVEEARLSGRRVLIFSQFTKMLDLIGKELTIRQLDYFYLDGQTPSEKRVEICNQFNGGERDFFLISMKAGGTGLNLTGADTVIMYDSWWNPAVEEQAADRAHRIGQKHAVQVIKLVARGTIEEKMHELQEKKRDLIEEIIDSKEKAASTLTEDDIRELLMIPAN